eukprot:scaffold1740_cov254-Pinguiococcus_pyrenoidosus.AAC.6
MESSLDWIKPSKPQDITDETDRSARTLRRRRTLSKKFNPGQDSLAQNAELRPYHDRIFTRVATMTDEKIRFWSGLEEVVEHRPNGTSKFWKRNGKRKDVPEVCVPAAGKRIAKRRAMKRTLDRRRIKEEKTADYPEESFGASDERENSLQCDRSRQHVRSFASPCISGRILK